MMRALGIIGLCIFTYVTATDVNIYIQGPVDIIDCGSNPGQDGHLTEKPTDSNNCPTDLGFFQLEDQCFKFISEPRKDWEGARDACLEQGMVLARPSDPVALRKYIVENNEYLSKETWIGARGGDGGRVVWAAHDGAPLSKSSPWWYLEPGYTGPMAAVMLKTTKYGIERKPGAPYQMEPSFRYLPYVCQVRE